MVQIYDFFPERNKTKHNFCKFSYVSYENCHSFRIFAVQNENQMKQYHIAAIGELNVDIILNRIESEPEIGKEKFAKDMIVTLGSSTAIFAANAAALGSRVCFVGQVGRDAFGDLVCSSLEAKGVDTRFIKKGSTPTGATICMNYGEDRANLTYQGAMDVMGYDDINPEVFDSVDHIHLSSLFMQSCLLRDIDKVLDKAAAKGITVSLDTQWDPMETWKLDYQKVLPKVTVFLPNEKELQALTGTQDLDSAIAKVLPYLGKAMVVKCGSKGSLLVQKDGSRHFLPAYLNKEVVDAIGAGDSFNSGFVSAFVRGMSLEKCQETGNLTGAVNTTAAGGTGAFSSLESVRKVCLERFGQPISL